MTGNQPAFPLAEVRTVIAHGDETRDESWNHAGLTKREYFAGLAMQGLLAHPLVGENSREWIVREAVQTSDALLAELAKEQV